jgi:hypothetical protein
LAVYPVASCQPAAEVDAAIVDWMRTALTDALLVDGVAMVRQEVELPWRRSPTPTIWWWSCRMASAAPEA